MSSYSLSNSAPINNVGYYDGNYFNQQQNNQYQQISNQQFNHHIADTYNNNNSYEIYPTQNYPSSSLFLGDSSGNSHGYTSNNGEYCGAIINRPHNNRNTVSQPNQIYVMENFENDNPDMEMARNANRLDKVKSTKENPRISNNNHRHQVNQYQHQPQHIIQNNNQYIPRQPTIQYNDYHYNNSPDYLNVGSIPNIAGLYNNNINRPIEKIIVKEVNNDK